MDFNRTWMLASSYRLGRPWIPIFKFWLIRPSMGPCHVLKFLPFKRSVDPFWKFGLIWPSVDPSLNSKWISRSWIPAFTLKNLDRFGRPWILASRCINPCILSGLWSMDINISDWAVHLFFLTGLWIPIFRPVHGSLFSDLSFDPHFLTGPWIPIFWPVHRCLFSDRSTDPYFLTGPWIPIFWPVHGSPFSDRSMDP